MVSGLLKSEKGGKNRLIIPLRICYTLYIDVLPKIVKGGAEMQTALVWLRRTERSNRMKKLLRIMGMGLVIVVSIPLLLLAASDICFLFRSIFSGIIACPIIGI